MSSRKVSAVVDQQEVSVVSDKEASAEDDHTVDLNQEQSSEIDQLLGKSVFMMFDS